MKIAENLIFLGYQVKVPQQPLSKITEQYKWYNYASANVVYIDDYTVKNRYSIENPPPKDYEPEGFAVFWDEEKKILKFCSKTYSRMEKLKKLI